MRLLLLLTSLAFLTACDAASDGPDADAAIARDAGDPVDGGDRDAGAPDAGAPDAGPLADAGSSADGGTNGGTDGGAADAGVVCSCAATEVCAEELCVPDVSAGAMQRPNLPEDPASPRFVVPADRVWPASPDAPHIALWYDDALAAITITIDDNSAPDHDWWLTTAAAQSIPLTWFVITDRVGTSAFFGAWDDFSALADAGHSIQSHGAVSGRPPDPPDDPYFIDTYSRSITALEAQVASPVDTIAHPWGVFDRSLVQDYYLAGRGTTGQINRANQIDYLDTASRSNGLQREAIDEILGSGRTARGWYSVHYHLLQEGAREATAAELDYINTRRADLWVGTFRDVARYGQERDTAALVVHHTDAERVVFSVTDEMQDGPFDQPLTVKVRMPSAGSDVRATQGGEPIRARFVMHEGAPFGLLDVVPDSGPVVARVVP